MLLIALQILAMMMR